jgi:NAD(P)-dependent dehydrogenase (short-subunit alcohol dehydrogenase family)
VTATVAITGASAGIGRAAGRLFAQRGDGVGLIALGQTENLWKPADDPRGDDYRAHGELDDRSHPRSAQLFLSRHRLAATTAGAAIAAVGAVLASRARRR